MHIIPHWNWKGEEGKEKTVTVYSNCDEVELFLNGISLGKKTMEVNGHLEWKVNYQPGVLMARGLKKGKDIISENIETTNDAKDIHLTADRSSITANGTDVSVVKVGLYDAFGRFVPTANNDISFSIDGPGKIIGVGNGDPSSHEPDKFIDTVKQIKVENLKIKVVDKLDTLPEIAPDFDDSKWQLAFPNNNWDTTISKPSVKGIVIRGKFTIDALNDETEITLYPKSLGEEQAIYINGNLILKEFKRDQASPEIKLEHSILHQGENEYVIVGLPLLKKYRWDNLNTDPGIIKVLLPAGKWTRSTFNGLAQVIIQSTQKPGEIMLKASSPGLNSAVIKLHSQPVIIESEIKN